MNEPFLRNVAEIWEKQIRRARTRKYEQFGRTADRAWAYLGKDYQGLYIDARDDDGQKFPYAEDAVWKTRRNLAREYVAVMLPYVAARVPDRLVSPRRPGLPPGLLALAQAQNPQIAAVVAEAEMEQRALEPIDEIVASLMQWMIGYLPSEYDLQLQQRRALPEALVKGRALVWHELQDGPYGLVPVSIFDTVDGLLCDPDARSWVDQGFIIRQRRDHIHRVSRRFHEIDPELLRKHASEESRTEKGGQDLRERKPENDPKETCVYYEVFSRMGIGQHFADAGDDFKPLAAACESLGQNIYVAILPGLGYPLNLPPGLFGDGSSRTIDDIKEYASWPIPFHEDRTDPWPCSVADFLPNANDPWATSPLEGALPLLAFIDHTYSYMLSRVKSTSRNIALVSKALEEAVATGWVEGLDLEMIRCNGEPGVEFDKLFKLIEFPEFKRDLLHLLDRVETAFQMASGMMAPLYGETPASADRSATATNARESRLSSRPDDFADCVERWHSRIGSKEGLAVRLYVGPETVAPMFGEAAEEVPDPQLGDQEIALAQQTGAELPTITVQGPLTRLWSQYVQLGRDGMSREQLHEAAAVAAAELTYTVAAGSGRRKNRQKEAADFKELATWLGPMATQYAQMGNPQLMNWLLSIAGQVYQRDMAGAMLAAAPMPNTEDQGAGAEGNAAL